MLRKSIAMTLIMSAVLGLAGANANAATGHQRARERQAAAEAVSLSPSPQTTPYSMFPYKGGY